jgi:glycosyltransferase involved in cell wall biosynthesis
LVAEQLRAAPDASRFIILPATADQDELRSTTSALDVVLHTSSIGESFGYGIAEPMNLGKPVVTHSVPWADQAQIELVRHRECGFVASTPSTMAAAMLELANDSSLRIKMGANAQRHIRTLADPEISLNQLENAMHAAVERRDNPLAGKDFEQAKMAAAYLDAHQFGHTMAEQFALRPFYYRVRFHQFRKFILDKN